MRQQHPQPKSPLTSWHVPAHQQSPALRLRTTYCSYPAHNIDETIIVICFFKMTCSTLLASNRTWKFSNTLLAFFHNHRRSGTTTFGAELTVDVVWSIANSPSGELDTPSVKRAATLPSELAIQIWCKTWLMANELLHGGFTYLFIKC